jgi:hypothetical protein
MAGKHTRVEYAITGGTGAYEGARGTFTEQSGEAIAVIRLSD